MSNESLLSAERVRAQERIAALTASYDEVVAASKDTNADDEHDPEGATIAFERSQTVALVRSAREHLAEIDAAIERVELGIYGRCEQCWKPIGDERLEARPAARRCIGCASK